jgi:hypothetical protein
MRLATRGLGHREEKQILVLCAAMILALALLTTGAGTAKATHVSPQNDATASLNNLRTGWDPHEPGLSPAVVSGDQFGEVFSTAVNGQVYAQPLVIGSTVIVATENDWVYGLTAATGAIEWSTSLGTPYAIPDCSDLTPSIGITSAPVYDASTGSVYTMANVVIGKAVEWRMFGLNVATGAVTLNSRIAGHPYNDKNITIDAADQMQRSGLLLLNGWVYASFSSHCDNPPWAGFVAGVDVAGRHPDTLWTDEAGVTDDMAGIWQGGGGLMSPSPKHVIVTSGNGISPAAGPGDAPPGQLAESVIQLVQRPDGELAAQDFFSPANAPSLDAGDLDFGSGGPVGFPVGTTAYPHILVQAGKYGVIYLLNRDSLGGREQGPGGTDDALFASPAYNGLWGHPALFEQSTSAIPPSSSGLSDYAYYLGRSDYLRAFQVATTSTGLPTLTDAANSTFQLGYTSGSPVVTSNGTDPSSAVVWVVDSPSMAGTGASLVAFAAEPQPVTGGGLQLQELGEGPIGTAGQFSIAATSNGMVYVGTRDGNLLGFGVTSGSALRRSGTAAFGDIPVNSAITRTATVTAARTVTVTRASLSAVTSPDPFSVGQITETTPGHGQPAPVSFPVTLHRGSALHAQVRFSPTAPGGTSGALSFATAGGVPASVPLIADGTRTGLQAATPTLPLLLSLNDGTRVGPVPVGLMVSAVATIVNDGTAPQRITKVTAPRAGGPLTYRALPKPGTLLRPGQSVSVQVIYAPTKVVPAKVTLTVTGSSGAAARVAITGTSQAAVSKIIAPKRVGFGDVRVGHTARRSINLLNDGNTAATVLKTVLLGPFRLPYKVNDGLPFNGGYNLAIPVTFTPSRTGRFTGSYTFSWTDWFGTHAITIPISATGVGQPLSLK